MFKQFHGLLGVLALVFLVGLLGACAPQTGEVQPPEIVYGQDMCDHCGMLISEPKFASALVLEDGTAMKFDDTGEMLKYMQENPDVQVKAWFVHDYDTEAWVNAEAAHFVAASGLASPMGFGIAAFETTDAAQRFAAAQNAEVMTFAQIMESSLAGGGMGMNKEEDMHGMSDD
jgi:copper chaperone NosL